MVASDLILRAKRKMLDIPLKWRYNAIVEVSSLGMTNEQFDSYKTMLLRRLQNAIKHGKEKEVMEQLVEDLEEELQKPRANIAEVGFLEGMTNEQFDSYKKLLLRQLEEISEEVQTKTQTPSPKLARLIEDLREELRKP